MEKINLTITKDNCKSSIHDWKRDECTNGIRNEDVVENFYCRLTRVIQSQSIKNKWEEYEVQEILDNESIRDKLEKVFFKLR
jgi:hypothetical protein